MPTIVRNIFATLLLLVAVSTSFAANDDFLQCREMFANSQPPTLQNQDMAQRALCYSSFAIMHSGKSHTPIYVAQRLNKVQVEAKITRATRFFAEARLPRAERAELKDYRDSGFDRGHMAPAGDMADEESMAQSFSLANMVPQYPINNRKSWAGIERATRKYVMRAAGDTRPVGRMTLGLTLLAIGDSLAGGEVARACGIEREAVRDVAIAQIEALSGEALRD